MVTFVKTKAGIQVFSPEGKGYMVASSHPFFVKLSRIVVDPSKSFNEFLEAYEASKVESILKISLGDNLEITKKEGILNATYKGLALPENLQRRLIETVARAYEVSAADLVESALSEEGLAQLNPVLLFVENLMGNPSHSSVDELYGFLESCSLPITNDGCFLAYKKVNSNYTDIHSATFDNSVNAEVEMERWQVDDDRNKTCSTGFHCCSFEYLKQFGSNQKDSHRVVVVKVNPKDVVSVPSDYDNQKMRVCRYEVIDEIPAASAGLIPSWYVPPVLEGKLEELIGEILSAVRIVAMKWKLKDLLRAVDTGINFNTVIIVPLLAEDMLKDDIVEILSELGADVSRLDFDDFDKGFSINNIIEYVTERIC